MSTFILNLALEVYDDRYFLSEKVVEEKHYVNEFVESMGWAYDAEARGYIAPRTVIPVPEEPPVQPETM